MSGPTEERLSGALQENILVLLCFSSHYAKMVRASVTPQLFESSVFREVAGHAIDFLDQFGEPIAEHLPDHIEDILKGDDKRKASTYEKLLGNLFAARDTINGEYVLSQLHKFVRLQIFKAGLLEAVEAADDGRIDAAEVAMHKALSRQVVTFESGVTFNDPAQVAGVLDQQEPPFLSGIEALDRFGVGPARKALYLGMAPLNRGKSWWLGHLGKWGILQRLCVVHVTLEMSELKTALRYLQMFYAISKRAEAVRRPAFVRNREGDTIDIDYEDLIRPSLADPDIKEVLARKVRREFKSRQVLKIKAFPTGQLTIPMLRAYLDGLERFEKITPDMLIVDYPALMQVDPKNLRTELGEITKQLRGLGVERNMAVCAVAQSNREGLNARQLDESNMAEDFSQGFTADIVATYNQTAAEHRLGVARIYVSKNRDDDARMTALITQSYAMGQFCLDSTLLTSDYWSLLDRLTGRGPEQGH